ncbi:hypothetical protein AVEN_125576-1 [Araneus ventricosus]|uniref:Uncharacterized protein n=1 Tax=Araneus ventricosus TaxID=182803 RepID=A0A4Y2N764_ARAVE|nr:hypothetical protein AVEN_125576-1 [Araneus ventricosus]
MSLLDESRWKKHGERYAMVITDDRGNTACLRSSMRDREQLLFAVRVDIDAYDASGNIVHIAGKSEFPMLRNKRQYKHSERRSLRNIDIFRCIENRHSPTWEYVKAEVRN